MLANIGAYTSLNTQHFAIEKNCTPNLKGGQTKKQCKNGVF